MEVEDQCAERRFEERIKRSWRIIYIIPTRPWVYRLLFGSHDGGVLTPAGRDQVVLAIRC